MMVTQQRVQWQEEGDADLSEVTAWLKALQHENRGPLCFCLSSSYCRRTGSTNNVSLLFTTEKLRGGAADRARHPFCAPSAWGVGIIRWWGPVSRELLDGGGAETPTGPCREMLPLTSSSWAHSPMALPKFHLPVNEPSQDRPTGSEGLWPLPLA